MTPNKTANVTSSKDPVENYSEIIPGISSKKIIKIYTILYIK